ncbi:MAG: class II aldolase/adducin family protein [Acidimicrobiia bacterium]
MEGLSPQQQVAISRRILAAHGCESTVGGHVSLRAQDDPSHFYFSPFQYFADTLPRDVARLDADLGVVEGTMLTAPAAQFHRSIYRARPDVGSVIHIHSYWVAVFSTTRRTVATYNMEGVLLHDDQVFYEDDGVGPLVDGDTMARLLGDRSIILIKNHGAVIAGSTIAEATVKALTLERCAKIQIDAEAIRGVEVSEAVVQKAKPSFYKYFIPQMWEVNVERLRRTVPEIFEEPGGAPAPARDLAGVGGG